MKQLLAHAVLIYLADMDSSSALGMSSAGNAFGAGPAPI